LGNPGRVMEQVQSALNVVDREEGHVAAGLAVVAE
jgi:hypothetical protein